MRRLIFTSSFLAPVFLSLLLLSSSAVPTVSAGGETAVFPLMHPDEETLREWVQASDTAARTASASVSRSAAQSGGSVNLLSHMVHIPSERSQGGCGNCWVWAGTGCMEIALSVQESIQERLSVQVLNSCRDLIGKSCCQGGWLHQLAAFYTTTGYALPWDNLNADWQDGDGGCSVPCGDIAIEPSYRVEQIEMLTVPAHSPEAPTQAEAIANIKAVLDEGKGVWFAFFAPSTGWQAFTSFWLGQGESAVVNLDALCAGSSPYAGHAVLCVGYNDLDPNNRYWVMLNSWGTAGGGRPNGLFRVNMDMNYDTTCGAIPAFFWQTLDVRYRRPPEVSTGNASAVAAQTATVQGTLEYDSETDTSVRFEYGTTPGGPYPEASAWQEGFSSPTTFEAELSGLHGGTRHYYRAVATNSGGTAYGDELSFLTEPLPPASFSAQAEGQTEATVTWYTGEGAQTTVVWRKKDSPPDTRGDGYLAYEGSGTTANDTALDPGSRYYYRAWSSVNDGLLGTVWSGESSQDCAHTIGNGVLVEGDVNLDGAVNIIDAMQIAQYVVGLGTLSPIPLSCADTTDDSSVNIVDAMHIAQFTVDPDGVSGILFKPLWQSPHDEGMVDPLSPCGT